MAGYFLTARDAIAIELPEPPIRLVIPSPEKLRTAGALVHFDNVSFKRPRAAQAMFEGVSFTVGQGSRCAFVGAVRAFSSISAWAA